MEKYKAIPQGYMTVGEVAKKMGVTVRTLQYYDKEGVLPSSGESEGGRRLYTHKDIVKLHQIQSMKYLGFSLEDIKTRLPSINTPEEVSSILTEQAKGVREKIKSLKEVLVSIEKLNKEVSQMDTVNWAKYADIIVMLQAKNNGYWVMKYMSDNAIDRIRTNFDDYGNKDMMNRYNRMIKTAAEVQKNGLSPESEEGQALAKEWFDFILEFTEGDMSLMPELLKMGVRLSDIEWKDNFSFDKKFIERAMSAYITSIGYNPFNNKSSGDTTSTYERLLKKAAEVQSNGFSPESEQGQAFAKEWWDFIVEFTGGDMSLLPSLMDAGMSMDENDWKDRFSVDRSFVERALDIYFESIGYNPFEGEVNA